MWLVTQLLALAAAATQAGANPSAATPPMPQTIATRQTLFAIPFRIPKPDHVSQEPVEVQLWVSGDRGANWDYYSKAEPARQQFMFRAGADGEYWFLVRTLDRSGRLRPESTGVPGLRVVVDTTPPKLQLQAQQGPAGQVTAQWKIDEPNPKSNSLTIQYRTTADGPWQPVAIGRQNDARPAGTIQTGEVTWWPQAGSGVIQIRAEVADTAGNPAVSHAQVVTGQQAGRPQQLAGSGLPPGERPRVVNSRMFELDYDVESVGPSGIARVDLFGTRDGGQTWQSYATDDDNRSPLPVTVDEEGIYGFRVVVLNGAGLGGQPPKTGELPEVFVGVDLTKPTAQITAAKQGTGHESGQLIICWQADDKMLAARPVTLSFSEDPGGPWTTIAGGLENTGRYAWPIDNRMPHGIYLRLEVRDEAGNLGAFQTTEPVSLDGFRPSVRIRNVRPLGQSARRPPATRYYSR